MRTIWKFPIKIAPRQMVAMPCDARPIHAGLDPQGEPCIWAEVDTNDVQVSRLIILAATGGDLPSDDWKHLSTFNHGEFVWHAYI